MVVNFYWYALYLEKVKNGTKHMGSKLKNVFENVGSWLQESLSLYAVYSSCKD